MFDVYFSRIHFCYLMKSFLVAFCFTAFTKRLMGFFNC